ncbi:antibiotic biosynthesis monooxygenase [Chitinophaga caseinilytica]|uniref:antibiotic biosynthesis monooxygenase n=1 Tax=Chitinophaga caseinilytica TaxID=2267521 RepID=UPI003C2B1E1E
MITVKVTYTVQPAFAQQNLENIRRFMKDFREMEGFQYAVYTSADGNTFTHISHHNDAAVQQRVLAVPSFLAFQQQRDASGLTGEPQIEVLHLADAVRPII